MMKKIHIPNPCPAIWELMEADECGRFCTSCSKSVVDLSQKSQHEIVEIYKNKHDEAICGRFYKNQSDRKNIKFSSEGCSSPNSFFHKFQETKFFLAVFSLIIFFTGCSKSETQKFTKTDVAETEDDILPANESFAMGEFLIEDDSQTLRKSKSDSCSMIFKSKK